ncbi:transposase [Micromonospora sp. ATCC 39149]|nr:transposase [Micromonospora sp. ATCC 39149]
MGRGGGCGEWGGGQVAAVSEAAAGRADGRAAAGPPRRRSASTSRYGVVTTLKGGSRNAARWSCRSVAEKLRSSNSAIGFIWLDSVLKPHRADISNSTNPLFIERVVDVVGLYHTRPGGPSCSGWTRRAGSRPSAGPDPESRHLFLDRRPKTRPAAVHSDQDRRRGPRITRTIL